MAEKRMFSKGIIDSDHFLNMSATSRLLYYDLGMRADDDGFLNDAKKIIRMTGASEGDLKSLIENEFVISFRSGIIVITHWKVNNYLRGDRYKGTRFLEEKSQLQLSENGQYIMNEDNILGIPSSNQITTNGIPMVDEWCTQSSIDKSSIDKSSIDVEKEKEKEKENKNDELSNEESKFIAVLKTIDNYPLDIKKDITYYHTLCERYPKLDIIEVVQSFAIYKMDNPIKPKDNPRSQLNTNCAKSLEWNKCLKKEKIINETEKERPWMEDFIPEEVS